VIKKGLIDQSLMMDGSKGLKDTKQDPNNRRLPDDCELNDRPTSPSTLCINFH